MLEMRLPNTRLPDTRSPGEITSHSISSQDSGDSVNSYRPTAACEPDIQGHHQRFLSSNVNRVLDARLDCSFFHSIIESHKGPEISTAPLSCLFTPVALLNRTSKSYDISNFTPTTILPCSNAQHLAPIELTILAPHYHILIPQLSQSLCPIPKPIDRTNQGAIFDHQLRYTVYNYYYHHHYLFGQVGPPPNVLTSDPPCLRNP